MVREILSQEEFHVQKQFLARAAWPWARARSNCLTHVPDCSICLTRPGYSIFQQSDQREVIYRLLRGPRGENLRAIATLGEQSNRQRRP